MTILVIIAGTIIALYGEVILSYVRAWNRTHEFKTVEQKTFTEFSIIIPARNEATSIKKCLNGFQEMNYNQKLFEVLVLDDNSNDNTAAQIEEFILSYPETNIRLISSKGLFEGKKKAIEYGVEQSKFDHIITSDADCWHHPNYLLAINAYLQNKELKLVCGPVLFEDEPGFFKQFQQMEFSGLITSSAAGIFLNKPIMSNGANLIFQKSAFIKVNAYEGSMKYASGDDLTLLMKIKNHFGSKSIGFIKSKDAIVKTRSTNTLNQFISQRVRWASKSAAFKDLQQIRTSIIVLLANLLFFSTIIYWILNPGLYLSALIIIGFKILIDIPLYLTNKKYFGIRTNAIQFVLNELLIAVYTVFIAFYSQVSKRKWKDRPLKST